MAKNDKGNKYSFQVPRCNHEIKGVYEVRLIYKENKDIISENDINEVMSWRDAINLSKKTGLDLIEINPNSNPVIIKLGDFSKHVYDLKKRNKQKPSCDLKEIKITSNIAMHDLKIKVKKSLKFLENGDKVKLILTLRGREIQRKDESRRSFYEFINMMLDSNYAECENKPIEEETRCYVIFKKK